MLSHQLISPARITHVMGAVPLLARPVEQIMGGDLKKSDQFTRVTGIEAVGCGKSAYELCLAAAKKIPDLTGVKAVVVVTQTPKDRIPSTSHLIAHELGLPNDILCFDINQSCSGYVYGIYAAFTLVNSGLDRVLLCVGDDLHSLASNLSLAALFGAGGSATLIERTAVSKYYDFAFYSDGGGYGDLTCSFGGGITMKADPVFEFATKKVTENLQAFGIAGHKVVLHQANGHILDRMSRRLGVPIFKNLELSGNTSSASIPLVLVDEDFDPSGNLLLCGFGAGLSMAACKLPAQDFKRSLTMVA
jgi:3-oxoacyl-[acyl-carrier-protein] synthase-3